MIALDTNVLVRLLVEDDEEQSARVARFLRRAFDRGERCFVADVVVAELAWVLARSYRLKRPQVSAAIEDLLQAEQLVFQSDAAIARALQRYGSGKGDLADYVVSEVAREHRANEVATLDGALLGEAGFRAP